MGQLRSLLTMVHGARDSLRASHTQIIPLLSPLDIFYSSVTGLGEPGPETGQERWRRWIGLLKDFHFLLAYGFWVLKNLLSCYPGSLTNYAFWV